MAPEQIEGKEADARCDIFAFGAVLYEMVAGKRPFSGKSQISLASSILEADPEPISAIKPNTPPAFEHVVTTCLQKNPEERYQTAHDIKLELQWIAAGRSSPAVAAQLPAAPRILASVLAGLRRLSSRLHLGAVAGIFLNRPAQSAPSTRTVIDPPPKTTLNLTGDFAGPPVLSPDGASIAFTATAARRQDRTLGSSHEYAGRRMRFPEPTVRFFPSGRPTAVALGFFADSKLKTIDLNGGSPLASLRCPFRPRRRLGTGRRDRVHSEYASGLDARQCQRWNSSSPHQTRSGSAHVASLAVLSSRWQAFSLSGHQSRSYPVGERCLYYASLDGRENRPLFRSQSNAVYGSGFLLFARGDQLMAQSFDACQWNA